MYRFFSSVIFVVMLSANLFAQHNNYALRNYTAVHGLPQSQVNSIVEDSNGYLWMSTFGGGLARFDGQDFKVYTTLDGLLSNIINHVTMDSQKNFGLFILGELHGMMALPLKSFRLQANFPI